MKAQTHIRHGIRTAMDWLSNRWWLNLLLLLLFFTPPYAARGYSQARAMDLIEKTLSNPPI